MLRPALLFALFVALLAGCQPPAAGPGPNAGGGPSGGKLRIAVIPKGKSHEFWQSVHFGAQQAAEKYGVEIIFLGPLSEGDRGGQIDVFQNFVTQKVDGICLAPLDAEALVEPVRQATKRGIPVVIFDSALNDESLIVSYVATDNRHGGEMAADEMARRLGGKGKAILFRYAEGSESTEQRESGFLERMKGKHPDIEVVSSNQYLGTKEVEALDRAQRALNAQKGNFDGVFAVCESNAVGVLGALEEQKVAEKVCFIGFDPSDKMCEALEAGKMKGMILQDPVRMGYLAVETMVKHLKKEPVEKRVNTGEYLATPENAKDPAMAKLLHPPKREG